MEESLKFYQEIVGLPLNRRFAAGPGVEIAFLGDDGTKVELICSEKIKEVNIGSDRGGLGSLDNRERVISGKPSWFIPLPSTSVWRPNKPHRESCRQAPDDVAFYYIDQSTLQAPSGPRQLNCTP